MKEIAKNIMKKYGHRKMKTTDQDSYNDITLTNLTDGFLLLVLKNLKFREKEIKEEIKMVLEEIERRGLEC